MQKYGGTSLGGLERIRKVAQRIAQERSKGKNIVVVLSAMAGETDRLLRLVSRLSSEPDLREVDLLLSTGEQVSVALLSLTLQSLGCPAQSFNGSQAGIITDDIYGSARIKEIKKEKILHSLKQGKIPVVAGFQGINLNNEVTTLGRGGSDISALALAAALKADLCEIYTDVEGVYTADPRVVPRARKLEKISYEEMLEMSSLGARVLQIRSVVFAKKYNVPLVVRSSFNFSSGTLIVKEDMEMEEVFVSGISYDSDQAKITLVRVPDRPGIAARIFSVLAKENITVDMIIQNIGEQGLTDLSFTLRQQESKKAIEFMSRIARDIEAEDIVEDNNISKVSIVGVGMRAHSGIAARMFSVLARENINIMMISTSEIKISCVIEAKYTELAVRILHEEFGLEKISEVQGKRQG